MQKSDNNNTAKTAHRRVQASTTLNRKYVKRPMRSADVMVQVKRSPRVKHFQNASVAAKVSEVEQPVAPVVTHPMQVAANAKMKSRVAPVAAPVKMSAKELKDQAIQKALANAAKPMENEKTAKAKKAKKQKSPKVHFGLGRVVLALKLTMARSTNSPRFISTSMHTLLILPEPEPVVKVAVSAFSVATTKTPSNGAMRLSSVVAGTNLSPSECI